MALAKFMALRPGPRDTQPTEPLFLNKANLDPVQQKTHLGLALDTQVLILTAGDISVLLL